MKAKILFFLLFFSALCAGCSDKEDEVPPYKNNNLESYIMPKPALLIPEEREWLKAQREEYNNAMKGQ